MSDNIGVTDPVVIQFENVNEGRSYPFDDNAVLSSSDGKILSEDIIADMHVVIPTGNNAYLSSVYISKDLLSVCIKIYKDNAVTGALSTHLARDSFSPYIPYRMEKLTGSEDIGGIITFGHDPFSATVGVYRFEDRSVRIVDSAVSRYVPAGLRSIIDDRTGDHLEGDIKIEFPAHVVVDKDGRNYKLNLKSKSATMLMSSCEKAKPVNACGATPITSINGVSADDQNRLVIWFH